MGKKTSVAQMKSVLTKLIIAHLNVSKFSFPYKWSIIIEKKCMKKYKTFCFFLQNVKLLVF